VIVGFIDANRDEFGVEPICTTLQMAPSTYYAAKKRELAPSARAVRDAVMMQVLMVLWIANRKVYGSHKLWKAARRAGHDIGHDQVARLMKIMEIEGISRQRRKVFTTRQDPDAVRAPRTTGASALRTTGSCRWFVSPCRARCRLAHRQFGREFRVGSESGACWREHPRGMLGAALSGKAGHRGRCVSPVTSG
jgi:hypothetical protein